MRFYESADVNFYINKRNGWDHYCRYGPNKSWAMKKCSEPLPKFWPVYHDIRGKRKIIIEDKDLSNVPVRCDRRRPEACLPVPMSTRRIRLHYAGPLGYKFAAFPMNLREVKTVNKVNRLKALQRKHEKWFDKWLCYECSKRRDCSI